MLDALKKRLRDLRFAADEVATEAAPLIEAEIKSTTRTVQTIRVTPRAEAITIQAPDWLHKKSRERGHVEVWKDIVRETFARVVR